jgi:hypothetical protein
MMAEQEPSLTTMHTDADTAHVRDYSLFTWMFKWGAVISFIIAMFVMLIISN